MFISVIYQFGEAFADSCVERYQLRCPKCSNKSRNIKFKAPGHRITNALYNYARDLLADGLTNKMVSMLNGSVNDGQGY